MSNPCLILEWTDAAGWNNPWTGEPVASLQRQPVTIPVLRRPTVLQPDRETAETEAKRLASAHPDKLFAVFEATAVAKTVWVPSHITVAGQVFAQRTSAVLLDLDNEAQIPF
jgi:hypothetical protein